MKTTQKIEKKNEVNQKIEDSSKVKTSINATAHATFPLDYHSKSDLRLVMMFLVDTRNRNQRIKKYDLRQSKITKDNIWNEKKTNVKPYIIY